MAGYPDLSGQTPGVVFRHYLPVLEVPAGTTRLFALALGRRAGSCRSEA